MTGANHPRCFYFLFAGLLTNYTDKFVGKIIRLVFRNTDPEFCLAECHDFHKLTLTSFCVREIFRKQESQKNAVSEICARALHLF